MSSSYSVSSSSSSSSSGLASTIFSEITLDEPMGVGEGVGEEDLNAFVAGFFAESDSSSSSSSSSSSDEKSTSSDEKAVKIKNVKRDLWEVLKNTDGKDDKDNKDQKRLPFVNNTLGAFDATQIAEFSFKRTFNVGNLLQKFLHRPPTAFRPPLTAPAVRGSSCIVGTDDVKGTENFLLCMSCPPLDREADYFQIQSACRITEPARYPCWLRDGRRILACTFTGLLTMFSFNPDNKHITPTDVFRGVHTREIRELALCPSQDIVASTGADGNLCLTDLHNGVVVADTTLNGVGSSVKWTDSTIGVTLDSGRVMLFDCRTSLAQPQLNFACTHYHRLYTHACYSEHYVLLGYANGDIRNVDLRAPHNVVSQIQDPYVEGIGGIECRGNSFVTSGFSDYTVWNQDSASRVTRVWSHSAETSVYNQGDLTYIATWLDDDTVIATNSQGEIGVWTQGLDPVQNVTTQLGATRLS